MSDELTSPAAKRPAAWKIAAGFALLTLLVGVMAWQFLKAWQQLRGQAWTPHAGWMLLALLPLLLASLLDIVIWSRTLGWFTEPLPFRLAAPVYIWSSLARYIPGKVGSLLLRVGLAAEVGRPAAPVLAASAVELALRTASALFLFLLVLWVKLGAIIGPRAEYTAIAFIPLVLIAAHPRIMLPVLNWALRKMKRPTLDRPLRYRDVLGLFGVLLVRWVCFGAGVYAIAVAITPDLATQFVTLMGMSAGSWALGFIGLSPGGVGIMEGTQYFVLTRVLAVPKAYATFIYVLVRFWTLLGEGLWALAVWFMWRRRGQAMPAGAAEGTMEVAIE